LKAAAGMLRSTAGVLNSAAPMLKPAVPMLRACLTTISRGMRADQSASSVTHTEKKHRKTGRTGRTSGHLPALPAFLLNTVSGPCFQNGGGRIGREVRERMSGRLERSGARQCAAPGAKRGALGIRAPIEAFPHDTLPTSGSVSYHRAVVDCPLGRVNHAHPR